MGFESIIQAGLELADSLTESLQVQVLHYRWIRSDPRGRHSFNGDRPEPVPAILEMNPVIKYTRNGVLLPVKAKLTIPRPLAPLGVEDRREPVDPRDEFVLPDGSRYPIVEIPSIVDPSTERPYFSEVMLGEPVAAGGGGR